MVFYETKESKLRGKQIRKIKQKVETNKVFGLAEVFIIVLKRSSSELMYLLTVHLPLEVNILGRSVAR